MWSSCESRSRLWDVRVLDSTNVSGYDLICADITIFILAAKFCNPGEHRGRPSGAGKTNISSSLKHLAITFRGLVFHPLLPQRAAAMVSPLPFVACRPWPPHPSSPPRAGPLGPGVVFGFAARRETNAGTEE